MKDIEKGCEVCGKRLPTRNNQVSIECRKQGLCRECYNSLPACRQAGLVCEKCGGDIAKGKGLKRLTARTMGYCLDCYNNQGIVIEGDGPDYENNDSPYGWLDQFHEGMR